MPLMLFYKHKWKLTEVKTLKHQYQNGTETNGVNPQK